MFFAWAKGVADVGCCGQWPLGLAVGPDLPACCCCHLGHLLGDLAEGSFNMLTFLSSLVYG